MNTETEQYERIQDYLLGRMSDEERADFERDLSTDDVLRQQYEDLSLLARSIQKANQEVDLRISLEETKQQFNQIADVSLNNPALEAELDQVERELKNMGVLVDETTRSAGLGIRERVSRFFGALVQWFIPSRNVSYLSSKGNTVVFSLPYASRMAISFAVVTTLALGVFLPVSYHSMAVSGFAEAEEILNPDNLLLNTYRGDDVITDKLNSCYTEIQEGRYQEAFNSLTEVEGAIEEQLALLLGNDSAILRISELNRMKQETEWYRAVILMHEKKVGQAKKLLKQIAKSDSVYSEKAGKVLKEVY